MFSWYAKAKSCRYFLFQEYFYGIANDLSPHSNIANFNDLSVYKIGGGPQAPRSALPIGAEPVADPTRLVPVTINRDLLHLVLAVSFAKEPDQIISRYARTLPLFLKIHVIIYRKDKHLIHVLPLEQGRVLFRQM